MSSCVVVGAGMAGLTAAGIMRSRSCKVTILDKGRGVGGRMATRRIGASRFDHGAQFFTVRDARFREAVENWERAGLVAPWFSEDGHVRYRAIGGMNALAKHLAEPLQVRTETKVERVEPAWQVILESGETLQADTLLLTPPAPQSAGLVSSWIDCSGIEFDPCFALLAVLDGPSLVPEPGYMRPESGPIEWLADNTRKGVSQGRPAITIHTRADFTREYFDAPQDLVAQLLFEAAKAWIGSAPAVWQLHRWRYSKPLPVNLPPCLFTAGPAPLAVAGDAFAGGRVEGAFLSGLAAAEELLKGSGRWCAGPGENAAIAACPWLSPFLHRFTENGPKGNREAHFAVRALPARPSRSS